MKRFIVILLFVILNFTALNASTYNTGIGLRGGFSSGINFKHFVSKSNAFEITAATHYGGVIFTVLYERHTSAFDITGLQWYYGAGGHIGIYSGKGPSNWFPDNGGGIALGADGIVGLDYKIKEIPISISVDIMPRLNLFGHTGVFWGAGLSVRYVW